MNETATPILQVSIQSRAFTSRLFYRLDQAARRLFDVCMAVMALLLLSPVFGLIALRIRRDSPGPVFYWGERVGLNGRPFRILKFRTMYEQPESYNGPRITGQGDKRVTPFGQWLRETKLNELPQLWNVLRGDMSFVGPRPEDPAFVKHWPDDACVQLLSVRPGITSPASVVYRDEEKLLQSANSIVNDYLRVILPSKLRLDLLYVHHRTFFTDLDVIFWTLVALLPRLRNKEVPEYLLFWGPLSQFFGRYFSWFVLDSLMALGAVVFTGLLWRSSAPLHLGEKVAVGFALTIALVFSLVNVLLGAGRVIWSRARLGDALSLVLSTGLATAVLLLGNRFLLPRLLPREPAPDGMLIVIGLLSLTGFVTTRYRMRIITGFSAHWITLRGKTLVRGERVLIVGAGNMGELAAYLLRKGKLGEAFSIVGMVDDAPRKQGARIDGCRVLGDTSAIPELVSLHDVGLIMFAIERISPDNRARILALCHATPARTVIVPDIMAALHDQLPQRARDGQRDCAPPASKTSRRLCTSLDEIEALMQANAWEAAHDKLHEMRRELEKAQ